MFLHPLGLLALLGVPTVLALHLFRRRFRPRTVSALFLWREDASIPFAGRKRERLHRTPSFWLEMTAALLLGLAFAGPTGCGPHAVEHLVCVLDASASMRARNSDGTHIFDAAIEILRKRIEDLVPRSVVTLIRSGEQPSVLAGPAAFPQEALLQLEDCVPGSGRQPLAPAVSLAVQLAGDGTVLVLTDHFEPDRFPAQVELLAVGEPLDNLAITHAMRTHAGRGRERVLVTLSSFVIDDRNPPAGTAQMLSTTLTISTGAGELQRHTVELARGGREHFTLELPAGTRDVTLTLEADALEIDNRVFLARSPPRVLGLATTLPPREAERLGLATGASESSTDRWEALIPESISAQVAQADILIGSGSALDAAGPGTWILALEEAGESAVENSVESVELTGPFLLERVHPLLQGVTLSGIIWSGMDELALGGTPLVSAGARTLLTEEQRASGDERRVFRMNFIPQRSSLQRSPDWPILLANLAEMRRRALPGALHTNVAIGEPFRYRGTEPAVYGVRCLEDDSLREVRARELLVVEHWQRPGFYQLERAGEKLLTFGVSFRDGRESDLTRLGPGHRPAERDLALSQAALGPLETVLLVLALLALLGDWWVLQRARGTSALRGVEPPD